MASVAPARTEDREILTLRWPKTSNTIPTPSLKASWKAIRRLLSLTPMMTIGIVSGLTYSTWYFGWSNSPLLREHYRAELVLFAIEVSLLLWSYLTAVFRGPGFVPQGWEPERREVLSRLIASDPLPLKAEPPTSDLLQFCEICQCYKPPRAHHCSDCGRCVLWMDHHCPWTGTCVGHDNMAAFVQFTHYVPVACLHALIIHLEIPIRLFLLWYRGQRTIFWKVLTKVHSLVAIVMGIVALVVMLLVGSLAFDLHWSLANNLSMVEELLVDKAKDRRFVSKEAQFLFPYDLGEKGNYEEVFGSSWLTWILPIKFGGSPIWPSLREGSGAFDLSAEQLVQKASKLSRGVPVKIEQAFDAGNGSWACWYWTRICCRFGCTQCCCVAGCCSRRLSVQPGDWILVTNRDGGWVKAQKLTGGANGFVEGPAGWIPEEVMGELPEDKRYEVPHQAALQGTWEVDPSESSSGPTRRVRVVGPVARAAFSRLPFVLKPQRDNKVTLLGIELTNITETEATWANGEVWRRPPMLPNAKGSPSGSCGGIVSILPEGGSPYGSSLRLRRQPNENGHISHSDDDDDSD
mmetsp:Transcript_62405/g.136414  ORF Transcript_62405/g.136414 Transcript_62405/m.136414 type:complete len:576 (+) Transcript_62405:199-1926(+)